jgi:hypothetical protein
MGAQRGAFFPIAKKFYWKLSREAEGRKHRQLAALEFITAIKNLTLL